MRRYTRPGNPAQRHTGLYLLEAISGSDCGPAGISMTLTGAELVSIATSGWGLLSALITLALGESRRDASLYPFIAAVVCFFAAVPPASYFSGALFVVSLTLGLFLYKNI